MLLLLFLYLILQCLINVNSVPKDVDLLTSHFFNNLKEDPRLAGDDFNAILKNIIDEQVENYVHVIQNVFNVNDNDQRGKRSLPTSDMNNLFNDKLGVYVLSGFEPMYKINASYPREMLLFNHLLPKEEVWYALTLEGPKTDVGNKLIIYKLLGDNFNKIVEMSVSSSTKLALFSTGKFTFLTIVGNNPDFSGIYIFTPEEQLQKIQNLDVENPTSVSMWEDKYEIFLAITRTTQNDAIEIPIYRWLGQHFDEIQRIKTNSATRLTPFTIQYTHFLAVANFEDSKGDTNIYSEILKYDMHFEKFVSHQKILTNAPMDIKHFYFTRDSFREDFLIVANLYEIQLNGDKNYFTDSIMYKYVDGYFIPIQSFQLSGASNILPIIGIKGEFLLLMACKFEGIKAFQYDGWKFVESKVQFTQEVFGAGVQSMNSYRYKNKTIIVVANENSNGLSTNVFEPIFTHENRLKQFQDETLSWCTENLKILQDIDVTDIKKKVEKAPKHDQHVLLLPEVTFSDKVQIENLRMFESDSVREAANNTDQFDDLAERLNQYSLKFDQISEIAQNSLHTTNTNIFQGDVHIQDLTINVDNFFENTITQNINDINIDQTIANAFDLSADLHIDQLPPFQSVFIRNQINPITINNHSSSEILRKSNLQLKHLVVDGTMVLNNGLDSSGEINNINFTTEHVLLKNKDQKLKGDFRFQDLSAEILEGKLLNGDAPSSEDVRVEKVSVNNLFVGGFINGVDIPTLNKYALKVVESQTITKGYQFEFLHVDNLNANTLAGVRVPDDLILIENHEYHLLGLDFAADLIVDKLIVTNKLNEIDVRNGRLDVLLIDSDEPQHIAAALQFDHLTLMSRINLRAHFNSSEFERINPMKTIDRDIVISGDYLMSGNVNVEQLLKAADLRTGSGRYSFNKMLNEGIRLTDRQIPLHLHFNQHLNVEDIFVDKINGKEVGSFVVTGTPETQVISGRKQFSTNVQITGTTTLLTVNRINVQDLDQNVLKIRGDQTVNGRQFFEKVVANRITNVKTQFGERSWSDVVNKENISNLEGKTIVLKDVNVEMLEASSLICESTVNTYNFQEILDDTVFVNNTASMNGHKHFSNITINNITVNSQMNVDYIPNKIRQAFDVFIFEGDLILSEPVQIEQIFFNGNFNAIPALEFGERWMQNGDDFVIIEDRNYSSITVYGNVTVDSGFLGKVDLNRCVRDSVKTDEFHHFHNVEFVNDLVVWKPVIVNGVVEAINLEEIIRSQDEEQKIESLYFGQLDVDGHTNFKKRVSNVNLSDVCSLLNSDSMKHLVINGSAYFAKGPDTQFLNKLSLNKVKQTAWFADKESIVEGSPKFKHILFKEAVTVEGYVDGIQLNLLEKTYLSKTKDQNISSYLDFSKTVFFKKGLIANNEEVIVATMCDIELNEFMGTALLQGYDQLFENILFVNSCEADGVFGEFLVNNLNLETDVMLYNGKNIFTGTKSILGLNSNILHLDQEFLVQKVNILRWLQDSVLSTGTYALNKMTFYGHTRFSSGLSSQKFVNNVKFDESTILLKSTPQNITGKKYFTNEANRFKDVKLKGTLNDIDVSGLFESLVYQNGNATFTYPVDFTNNLIANNIHIKQLYEGVNVSALISNLTRLTLSNDYDYHYEYLLNVSNRAMESLRSHAFYFDYYKIRQVYNFHTIMPIRVENNDDQHLICILKTDVGYLIEFHVWDEIQQYFHNDPVYPRFEFDGNFHYGKMIAFDREFFYTEHQIPKDKYGSSIYAVTKEGLRDMIVPFHHNGSKDVESVIFPLNKRCLLLTFLVNDTALYCETTTEKGQLTMALYTKFPGGNVIKAKYMLIFGTPYVFVLHSEDYKQGSTLTVWTLDKTSGYFQIKQKMYVVGPTSFSTIYYRGDYFLAIASGNVYNALHSGLLEIRKFNGESEEFASWQEINLSIPRLVDFALLPSNELFLYVATENPSTPFMIFAYEGISGFVKKIVVSTLPLLDNLLQSTVKPHQHFLIAKSQYETRIVQTIFKGV